MRLNLTEESYGIHLGIYLGKTIYMGAIIFKFENQKLTRIIEILPENTEDLIRPITQPVQEGDDYLQVLATLQTVVLIYSAN